MDTTSTVITQTLEYFGVGHKHPLTGKSCADMNPDELHEIIGMLLVNINDLEDNQKALEDAEEIKIAVLAEADQMDEEIGHLKQRVKDIREAFE